MFEIFLPESIFKFPLHGLHVGILHQEGGAQLAELSELDLSGAVLVDLEQEVLQLLLGGPEAHGPHDLAKIISGQEVNLLCVEEIKASLEIENDGLASSNPKNPYFEALDLVSSQSGALGDVVELNSGVRIVVSHAG